MIAKGVPRRLLERMEPDALITGIDVTTVGDFIVVQYRATAAATVFHGAQFRFLKTRGSRRIGMKIISREITPSDRTRVYRCGKQYLLDMNEAVLAELPFLGGRLQRGVQHIDTSLWTVLVRQRHQRRSYLRLRWQSRRP